MNNQDQKITPLAYQEALIKNEISLFSRNFLDYVSLSEFEEDIIMLICGRMDEEFDDSLNYSNNINVQERVLANVRLGVGLIKSVVRDSWDIKACYLPTDEVFNELLKDGH